MSDEELMRSYQSGSEAAFVSLYDRYSPLVYGYSKKRLRAGEIDDFFQKVWKQLHEKRHLYKDQPFAPWFFVLIRNLLTDEYRSSRKPLPEVPASAPVEVDSLLDDLDPATADIVKKYYLEDISYGELAREYELSEGSLRQKISRAIKSLRKGKIV
jgi:RNA polymerase sigma factor (sigma-70 family)